MHTLGAMILSFGLIGCGGGNKPTAQEPVETEPVETEPVETEPVKTEPVETKTIETKTIEPSDEPLLEVAPCCCFIGTPAGSHVNDYSTRDTKECEADGGECVENIGWC